MRRVFSIILLTSLFLFTYSRDMVITKLNQSPIRIDSRTLKVGDTFSDTEVISWSSIKQDMKAKPKSGGLPRHYSAAAFKSKSQHNISIQQYLKYLNKTNRPSTLDVGDMYLQKSENSDKYPEKRIALVIGNSIYGLLGRDLDCPISDAEDVTTTLNELGFDTYTLYDAPNEDFHSALMKFSNVASAGKYDVALFYFCGHGSQNDGKNYLLPCDAKNDSPEDISTWISFDAVFESLSETGCKTKLAFLDACRNAPRWQTQDKASRLDQYDTMGSLVVYSTANNSESLGEQEEEARNTPFGAAFLESVLKPAENISLTIKSISESVRERTEYYTKHGESPRQVYTFGVGDVDFSFVKGVNIEAALSSCKYYLADNNPEMAIVFLNQLKSYYSAMDSIHQKEYNSIILEVNNKMLSSRVYLIAIKDTTSLKRFDYYSNLSRYSAFNLIDRFDEYYGEYKALVRKYPNHFIDTIQCFKELFHLTKNIITNCDFFAFSSKVPIKSIDHNKWILSDYSSSIVKNLNNNIMNTSSKSDYDMSSDNNYDEELYSSPEDEEIEGFFICSGSDGTIKSAVEIFSWFEWSTYPVAINKDGTKLLYYELFRDSYELSIADFKLFKKETVFKAYNDNSKSMFYTGGFSDNSRYFFLESDNKIFVYDTEEISPIHTFKYNDYDTVFWLNNDLIIKTNDRLFQWHINETKILQTFFINNTIMDVALSEDKQFTAAICTNGDLTIVNNNNANQFIFNDFIEYPSTVEFTNDNHSIWITSGFYKIKGFDILTNKTYTIKESEFAPHAWPCYLYFPEDTTLCYADYTYPSYNFKIFDVKTQKEILYDAELIAKLFNRELVNDEELNEETEIISSLIFNNRDNREYYQYDNTVENGLVSRKTSRDGLTKIEGYEDGTIRIIYSQELDAFVNLMKPIEGV